MVHCNSSNYIGKYFPYLHVGKAKLIHSTLLYKADNFMPFRILLHVSSVQQAITALAAATLNPVLVELETFL